MKLSFREYLLYKSVQHGCGIFMAIEAIASTAMEHPEWDMDEEKEWEEWESR